MACIAPFRALRYDPARASSSQVATQPYDKITPEMQDRYYAASPYNLVRIILGKPESGPGTQYSRAATYFEDWRRKGIFLQDNEPSIYIYVQHFTPPGGTTTVERRGFIALGRLEDYSAGIVFRHEQTLAAPKADRLDLLSATRAHFGQIFMLYSDPSGEVDALLKPASAADLEMVDEYGVTHQLWKISDAARIDRIREKMSGKKLIIADGHHRYETALAYRDHRRAENRQHPDSGKHSSASSPEDAPYAFAMMTFVNMDDPGLVILPTHRVVHGLPSFDTESFLSSARDYFSVEKLDRSIDAHRASIILREAGRAGMAFVAVTPDEAFLIDTPKRADLKIFAGVSLRQQSLDVVQLHTCLLQNVLGISEDAIRKQQHLRYIRDAGEAIQQVLSGGANVAFLMNPVRMQQVRDIAFAGEVLPQKSTDFYPKLLSGLTIYALE